MLLVGDVGGTNVRLALVEGEKFVKEEKFLTSHFSHLSDILETFLEGPIERACFAVAGVVKNQTSQMTNLNWTIDAIQLHKRHRIAHVTLLNDLEAAGWGLKRLGPQDVVTLNSGKSAHSNQAILAAGTGLGMVGLYWDGNRHHPFASEGGHADFAPRDEQEWALWKYLHKTFGHVSIERVVSGPGLEHLSQFLGAEKGLKMFVSLYGSTAGNLALQFMTMGGLYLAGGIAPKLIQELQQGEFMKAFVSKGRFESLLKQIPVHVVLNDNLSLLGALQYTTYGNK
jgi:glucokinase